MFGIPSHMPCDECGASVPRELRDEHECDPEKKLDWEMFCLREGLQSFEIDLVQWLNSSEGQFELYLVDKNRS